MGGTKQSAAALEDGLPAPHESSIVDAADANAVRASVAGMETPFIAGAAAFVCCQRSFTKTGSGQTYEETLKRGGASSAGVDCVVNLAVVRPDRQVAFDVNCRGTFNAIRAAVDNGQHFSL